MHKRNLLLNYIPRGSFIQRCTDGYWLSLGHIGTFYLGTDGKSRPAALMALQAPQGGPLVSG